MGSGCLCLMFKIHSEIKIFHGQNAAYFVICKRLIKCKPLNGMPDLFSPSEQLQSG